MSSFLRVNGLVRGDPGMEDSICIEIHLVVKVLLILTGEHITSTIGISEGIEKGLETALQKLHKRLLSSVLPRTIEHRELQNVVVNLQRLAVHVIVNFILRPYRLIREGISINIA